MVFIDCVGRCFNCRIDAVADSRPGKLSYHAVPIRITLKSKPLPPFLCRLESPVPISQFEGRVEVASTVAPVAFLRRDQCRPQHITPAGLVPHRIRSHELGGLKNNPPVFFQGRPILMSPVAQLGVVNRVRLLPDQKHANRARTVPAIGRCHLRPASTLVALKLGGSSGRRENQLVPRQAALQQLRPVPQGEMNRVPPMHLQVEFAEPTVMNQPRLLRWHRAGAINRRKVLREHNPALQFRSAGIGAFGKINRPSACPELPPVICCRPTDRLKIGQRLVDLCRRKAKHNFQRLTVLLMDLIFVL